MSATDRGPLIGTRIAVAVVFALALLILLVPIRTPFNPYDEGFAVFNATRIMGGEIPYRDFWSIYPPGQFYALAIVFEMFGTSLLVARLYDVVVRLTIVACVYLIAKQLSSRSLAFLACLTSAVLVAAARFYTYAAFPALALSCAAILSTMRYQEGQRRRWLAVAGTLLGLTFLVRIDIGLYAACSVCGSLVLSLWLRGRVEPGSARTTVADPLVVVLSLLSPLLSVVAVGYGAVSFASGPSNVWDQLVVFPATRLHKVRWTPHVGLWPAGFSRLRDLLDWLRFYSPPVIYAVAACELLHRLRTKRILCSRDHGAISIIIFGALLIAQALSRYDQVHLLPTSIAAYVILIFLCHRVMQRGAGRWTRVGVVVLLASVTGLYIDASTRSLRNAIKTYSAWRCHSRLPIASCVFVDSAAEDAVSYVQQQATDGAPIFVGNQRHDSIWLNDIGFYFLAQRRSATYWSELYPSVATTRPVQEQIVNEIVSQHVEWIVLVDEPLSHEPNDSALSSSVYFLDEFVRAHYAPVARFGMYEVRRRSNPRGAITDS